MVVPKELFEKAERYEKLKAETDDLYKELEEWANENGMYDIYVYSFGTAKVPEGSKQTDDGEYCDRRMTGEDSGEGYYYYPVENSSRYMKVGYSF